MFPAFCLLGLLGGLALMAGSQSLALAGVVAAGLGFANIWPMLFSITVEEKPRTRQRTQRPDVHGHLRRRAGASADGRFVG